MPPPFTTSAFTGSPFIGLEVVVGREGFIFVDDVVVVVVVVMVEDEFDELLPCIPNLGAADAVGAASFGFSNDDIDRPRNMGALVLSSLSADHDLGFFASSPGADVGFSSGSTGAVCGNRGEGNGTGTGGVLLFNDSL